MFLLLTGRGNSYLEFIAILFIFVAVLAITAFTTRWIANYQKKLGFSGNVELMEAARLGNNKYVQIVRIGDKYLALAVCKDTVTVLCEISKEELKEITPQAFTDSFKGILEKVTLKQKEAEEKPRD